MTFSDQRAPAWRTGVRILIVAAIVCAGVYGCYRAVTPRWTYRIKIEAELQTESGPRSGYAMMEIAATSYPKWMVDSPSSYHMEIRSEAGFIDLGNNRNIVILLGVGSYADKGNPINWAPRAFLNERSSGYDAFLMAERLSKMTGSVELSRDDWPTLVTFDIPSDP